PGEPPSPAGVFDSAHIRRAVSAQLHGPRAVGRPTASRHVPLRGKAGRVSLAARRLLLARWGALFRWVLLDPVAALCNGNDPKWRRYIWGTVERCIGLVIG